MDLIQNNLWKEAIIVGLIMVVIGKLITISLGYLLPEGEIRSEHQEALTSLEKYHLYEVSLFLTGLCAHMILEYIGANSWYCKYGAACLAN